MIIETRILHPKEWTQINQAGGAVLLNFVAGNQRVVVYGETWGKEGLHRTFVAK